MYYKKSIFVEYNIKANKEVLTFGDIYINKRNFYHTKNSIWIDDIDIDKILAYNTVSFAKPSYKYFIGYKDHDNNYKIKVLCLTVFKRT